MPLALESSYADSYYDSDLLKRGLPSSKKLGEFVDKYNYRVQTDSRIQNFYADVATRIVNAQMQSGTDGLVDVDLGGVDAEGNPRTVTDYGKNVFFDLLGSDYADLNELYSKRVKSKDVDASEYADIVDYREALVETKPQDTDTPYVSYDEFAAQLPQFLQRANAEQVVDKATGKMLTVGEVIESRDEQNLVAELSTVKDRDTVKQFVEKHSDKPAEQILTLMAENGVKPRFIKQARNYLVDQLPPEEADTRRDEIDQFLNTLETPTTEAPRNPLMGPRTPTVSEFAKAIAAKKDKYSRNKFIDDTPAAA